MTNIEESGQGLPDPTKEVDLAEQEMNLVQKSMQNAREQFSAIQLSAQLQIQEEVKKAAAQINKSQQFISTNVKILQQDSSSTQGKDLHAYDKIKTATEKSSSEILNEMQDAEASIKAAMDAANAATMNIDNSATRDIENNEKAIMKSMMEAESATADQSPEPAASVQPQVAGQSPIPAQQPGHSQLVKGPQTEGSQSRMSGMKAANAEIKDIENNEQTIMKAMMDAESAMADQVTKAASPSQPQLPGMPSMPDYQTTGTQPDGISLSDKAQMDVGAAMADQVLKSATPAQPQIGGMPPIPG